MVISLEGYKTSQQALIGDENAIQKQWQETPGYNMFNTGNTMTTSPTYQTTTVDIDMEKLAKDKEVEAGLGITLSSPMTDAEKKQYLNSISDEQYKLMRTYKNQGYSFEASKALMENADTLKNPTKRGTKKYKPKETAGQKAADVGMGILQSPGKRGYNIIGQRIDKATKRLADKAMENKRGQNLSDWITKQAVKVFGEDAVNAYVEQRDKEIENGTIFDGRTQTDILTPTLGYQRANYSNWTKAGEFVGDLATDYALTAPLAGVLKPIKAASALKGKAAIGALEGAVGMGNYAYGTEGRAPTVGELALGAGVGAAFPLAGAGIKGAKDAIKTEASAGAEKLIEKMNKLSPSKLQKFADKYGESVGKVMNDRGLKTRQDAYTWFERNIDMLDNAMKTIKGNFKSQEVTDVLKENIKHANKTLDKKNIGRLLELQEKNAREGLSMEEVQEVKRYFEANTKFSYKTQGGDKAKRATNLDTALRERQRKTAAENGLENLAQINRETQMAYDILNNSKDIDKGILGNVDVTDELLAIHYGGLDRALATYVTKSVLKSAQFQSKLVDILNRLSGHQTIDAVLADLNAIKGANTVKEFEALMKKRELEPALPAPKEGAVNDAGYNILQQGENIISTPEGTNIVQDTITELPK